MAPIRGRPVFGDVSSHVASVANVAKADELGGNVVENVAGSTCNRTRVQKVISSKPVSNSLQAVPTSMTSVAAGQTSASAAPVFTSGYAQLWQPQHSAKASAGDSCDWRDVAAKTSELVGQFQSLSLGPTSSSAALSESRGQRQSRPSASHLAACRLNRPSPRSVEDDMGSSMQQELNAKQSAEEHRVDPELDYDVVTYPEMCRRLGDKFSEAQLRRRWQGLHPVEAGLIIAGLTSVEADSTSSVAARSYTSKPLADLVDDASRDADIMSTTIASASTSSTETTGSHVAPTKSASATVPVAMPQAARNDARVAAAPSNEAWPSVDSKYEPSSEPTNLAVILEGMRCVPSNNPDDHVDCVLADYVDRLLQSSHAESQKHLPAASDLAARLAGKDRMDILAWLVQACDIMRLADGVLFSTVLTLDRYCTAAREPLPMEHMQKVLMAVICTVLKTCTVSDEVCMPLRDFLLHLCHRQVSFEEILTLEHRILQTLRFSGLSAPTPLDFLDAFCTPLLSAGDTIESNVTRCLANFLVQLSIFNAAAHYRQPHAVLAAAGVYVALCGLRLPHANHQALLHDVVTVCSDIPDPCSAVGVCATELHSLWLDFAQTAGSRVPCLLRKFSGTRLHQAILLNPPHAILPPQAAMPQNRFPPPTASTALCSTIDRRIPVVPDVKPVAAATHLSRPMRAW